MGDLSNILSSLPQLGSSELKTVIATAQALLGKEHSGTDRKSSRVQAKPGGTKSAKPKAPAQKVSAYANEETYIDFKSSEKALKAFLKVESEKAGGPIKLSDFKEGDIAIPKVVAGFYEARHCWFRAKAELGTKSPPGDDPQAGDSSKKSA